MGFRLVYSDFSIYVITGIRFSSVASKVGLTTSWVWDLHSIFNDLSSGVLVLILIKFMFLSGLAHLSMIFMWLSLLDLSGGYCSNYSFWLLDPMSMVPSSHLVWSMLGQDILNSYLGGFYEGFFILSGMFYVWRTIGVSSFIYLKYCSVVLSTLSFLFILLAYIFQHTLFMCLYLFSNYFMIYMRLNNLLVIMGFLSFSWSGHLFHVSSLFLKGIDLGLNLYMLFTPSYYLRSIEFSLFSVHSEVIFMVYHHLFLGVTLILLGIFLKNYNYMLNSMFSLGSNFMLSTLLFTFGLSSMIYSFCVSLFCVWSLLVTDYCTMMSIIFYHLYMGFMFILGSLFYISMFFIRELKLNIMNFSVILSHSCSMLGHLSYLCLFLGLYSFGIYIHNDIMCLLGSFNNMFSDLTIPLKPLFKNWVFSSFFVYLFMVNGKFLFSFMSEGTSDFMFSHMNSFTLHVMIFMLFKGFLYSRSSSLVSDKMYLGWVYPCDGPGSGGSCQVSSFDHLFLSLFWCYNCMLVFTFGMFWKFQSDFWGYYDITTLILNYLSLGDFSNSSNYVNGWLGTFLWSQSSQVMQTYGSFFSCYGLIFLLSHFIWVLSLMFLFSGSGYWEELMEFICWFYNKMGLFIFMQPSALSIAQGSLVGLAHYLIGGVGCSFSFFMFSVATV